LTTEFDTAHWTSQHWTFHSGDPAGDGKKLYFYGVGFEVEVYDAVTLKYERTWDLNNDVTGAGMIVVN